MFAIPVRPASTGIEDGHVVCTSPTFGPPLVEACLDVAVKAHPGFVPDRRRADDRSRPAAPPDRIASLGRTGRAWVEPGMTAPSSTWARTPGAPPRWPPSRSADGVSSP